MTTDRFYGGVSDRLRNLRAMLEYVRAEHPSRDQLCEWVISNTKANSRDAVNHHLPFLDGIELIELSNQRCSVAEYGQKWLQNQDSETIFEALASGVVGFNTILEALHDGSMTDEDIMDLLVAEFEDINMESSGVAARHREWLQVLGYVERSDRINCLTEKGRELATKRSAETDHGTAKERVSKLRSHLLQSEFACIPAGKQDLTNDIYPAVKAAYSNLCDDSYRCNEAHRSGRDQPEWKHAVRDIQQRVADKKWGRVRRLDERGKWFYLPRFTPEDVLRRGDLHDQFGGQRQRGISPCRDIPLILLFTYFAETDEGYKDTIDNDGTVVYTGEGSEGKMAFNHGNKAIRDHCDDHRELHLFETLSNGQVRYIGQYECSDWFWEELPDSTGAMRDAIRFRLTPVDAFAPLDSDSSESDGSISTPDSVRDTGIDDIDLPDGSETTERRATTRNDVVRNDGLIRKLKILHDNTCQVCGDRRLKGPNDGFSHAHHLMPLGEPHNGPDIPQNILVVCPNHHDDFENGMLTIDPQTLEVNHFYEDSVNGRTIETDGDHEIGAQYIAYHNQVRVTDG
ncbi:HNH endonuclease [Halocatena marina]|uniref:HNH endonuclease n=1 Tax=Halocatena marina TaxID=2934937 RepID=A0ABD5YV12_9EURY|nr:HNH endonuclease [Halocatena marina]